MDKLFQDIISELKKYKRIELITLKDKNSHIEIILHYLGFNEMIFNDICNMIRLDISSKINNKKIEMKRPNYDTAIIKIIW